MTKREELLELYPDEEFLFADGYDDAIIGVADGVVVYDMGHIIWTLQEESGMTNEEAVEFFDFNIAGAYMGEKTPIYVDVLP